MSNALLKLGPAATARPGTALQDGLTAQAGSGAMPPAQQKASPPPALSPEQMKALREECATYRNRPKSASPPTDFLGQLATPGPSCVILDMVDALRAMPQRPK